MPLKEVTVVIGQRGGGQILGVFTSQVKINVLKEFVKEFHEEGYVIFEKVKVNEFQFKKFGLYFK
jgi:hypothetical protein